MRLSALVLAACASTADWPGLGGVTVRDSAGMALVDNRPPAVHSGCIVIAAESKRTIPSNATAESGVPPLYQVTGGAVLRNGTIVILNAGTRQLLFFTESGQYLYASGEEGRGPGEFLRPDWFDRSEGDTLFVWDTGQRRLSLFSADGAFLASHSVPVQLPTVRGRFADGSLLVMPISLVQVGRDGSVGRDPVQYLRYDLQRHSTNLLAEGLGEEWVDGERGPYALPFGRRESALALGAFMVLGDNAAPVLRSYDLGGRLHRVVRWLSPAIAVTDEDRSDYREHYGAETRDGASRGSSSHFAAERPLFSAMEADLTGWIWVRLFAAAWEPPADWLVFDDAGILRCRVVAPSRLSVLEIGEDYLLGRERDELGEESVVLFNLTRHY